MRPTLVNDLQQEGEASSSTKDLKPLDQGLQPTCNSICKITTRTGKALTLGHQVLDLLHDDFICCCQQLVLPIFAPRGVIFGGGVARVPEEVSESPVPPRVQESAETAEQSPYAGTQPPHRHQGDIQQRKQTKAKLTLDHKIYNKFHFLKNV